MTLGEYIEHIEQETALKAQWTRGNISRQDRQDRTAAAITHGVVENSTGKNYCVGANQTADIRDNWRFSAHGREQETPHNIHQFSAGFRVCHLGHLEE